MGVTKVTWDSIKDIDFSNKKVVELGDQKLFFEEPLIIEGVEIVYLKNYFDLMGIPHTSIDWHGNNGVLRLDFNKPIPERMKGRYDIVTNFGFAEHVHDQYIAWKNIHDLVCIGGIIVSELPGMPNFPDHTQYPYYTTEFFNSLVATGLYKIVENRYQQHTYPVAGQVVFSILTKVRYNFITKDEFNSIFSMDTGASK